MGALDFLLVLVAGVAAGTINVVVGSGTLVTFPVLVALGVEPVVATMSNAVGLVPGNLAGAWGYRRELVGQGHLLKRLLPASVLGSVVGAFLLLHLPAETFRAVVPALVVLALVLVVLQPRLQRALAARRAGSAAGSSSGGVSDTAAGAAAGTGAGVADGAVGGAGAPAEPPWVALVPLVGLTGVYGGYFSAAQGIILLAVLGVLVNDHLQRLNGVKNVLVSGVNLVSGASFIIVGAHRIAWWAALAVGVGTFIGGTIGARYGRRLPPAWLRAAIVALGVVALVRLLA